MALRHRSPVFLASLLLASSVRVPSAAAGERHPARGKPWRLHVIDDSSRGADGVRLADVNGDRLMDIATGWEEGGITRAYLNPGHARATQKWPAVTVGRTRSVEDAVFVDLDGDGATDVVSSCEGRTRTMFVHWAPKDRRRYLDPAGWKQEAIPASRGKMAWMFAAPVQLDGRNGVDLVAGAKGGGAKIGWFEAPERSRALDGYRWHPVSAAGWIMSLVVRDMDGDGDPDLVTTDRRGRLRGCRWLENPGPGPAQSREWKNHFVGGRSREVMFMAIADLDGDGLDDVLVAAKKASVLYLRRTDARGKSWQSHEIPFPTNTGTAKGVAAGDIDGDGRLDIVTSCEHADGGRSGVTWLAVSGSGDMQIGRVRCEAAHNISGEVGIKFDRLELLDMDGDGDLDVLTCEERAHGRGLGVFWYENPMGKGR